MLPEHLPSISPSKDAIKIDDADPESSVPSPEEAMKRPMEMGYLMMDLSDRAELAKRRGDHAQAAKYYRAMGKAVPDRAISFSKACESHEAAGQWQQAAEMCRAALGRGGLKAQDYVRFVRMTLRKSGALTSSEVDDIEAVVKELRALATTPEGRRAPAELECELATRLEDAGRMRACVAELKELGRDPAKTKVYEWALALMEKDEEAARDILNKARMVGVPRDALASMERTLHERFSKPAAQPAAPVAAGGSPKGWPMALMSAIAIAAFVLMLRRRSSSQGA